MHGTMLRKSLNQTQRQFFFKFQIQICFLIHCSTNPVEYMTTSVRICHTNTFTENIYIITYKMTISLSGCTVKHKIKHSTDITQLSTNYRSGSFGTIYMFSQVFVTSYIYDVSNCPDFNCVIIVRYSTIVLASILMLVFRNLCWFSVCLCARLKVLCGWFLTG